ncbi:MAG: DUF6531 domain-containing protein, partial [Chloroflexota bacterium]
MKPSARRRQLHAFFSFLTIVSLLLNQVVPVLPVLAPSVARAETEPLVSREAQIVIPPAAPVPSASTAPTRAPIFPARPALSSGDPRLPQSMNRNGCNPTGNKTGDRRDCWLSAANQGSAQTLYRGKPINTLTGGEDYTVVDLSFPALGGQMVFQRSYSSLATDVFTKTLGYGWTHNHDTRLILPTDPGGVAGEIHFKPHSNNELIFYINGDGTYTPYVG